ncbi:ABC transporter ATP-binding protein [Clostridium botulinum]|uniref:ABC transporter ATP-binding protein n=1 Tax=Clostridium botulinum TaxID=1491 RepID=A0A846JBV6_CLOBO|nr:ABC transporter ATP-binding protein [Clostridium botulinum]ACA56104.1 peptide ABC transporter, Pep4E family, ATP-binding protein [Clostridium botulinum A3 str. Loch Maree]NFH67087.1 ABC transporter ATP-binding protein [Clostridium botulinum]NFJ10570.1 ABC transporter ATP-binding protein [Clostridium botulinum]NFK15585.1 ABC transporter ATP-binding protein [Clostridium botulinum]NFM95304.1 ABC transporter ATP-binding protein [Clostridium botulinum]
MKEILKSINITKVYGEKRNTYQALNGIDMKVFEGEFVGVMGPSGAGKSTLLNIISTIDRPTGGKILIDGDDITKLKGDKLSDFRRNKLGFIFQDFNLLDTLTVNENIALPLSLSKLSHKKIDKKVIEITEKLGIKDLLNKYPYEISGGQKQRVAAARALINKPALILADEPTGALDSKSSKELLETLSLLNERDKSTIMMVTHDAFAASYCSRVIFIKDGKLYKEIENNLSRKDFFREILDVTSMLGGENNGLI